LHLSWLIREPFVAVHFIFQIQILIWIVIDLNLIFYVYAFHFRQTDKASIVLGTINYVEKLQRRVMELEVQQNKRGKEPIIILDKESQHATRHTTSSQTNLDNCLKPNELLPNVKVKVLERNILIYITCEKESGIELKILDMLQNLHLFVTSTSVLPFGNSTLGITTIALVRFNALL